MADAIWVLLRSWHREFYRFGRLEQLDSAKCIEDKLHILETLRERTIESLSSDDEPVIRQLSGPFTEATRRHNKRGVQGSEVATAKALHLLAPRFLPLWDNSIAGVYSQFPMWAHNYICFCWQMKDLAAAVRSYIIEPDDRTLLKQIDEFNYSAYTKRWIRVGSAR